MGKNLKIYESPYSSLKKITEDNQSIVKKKYKYTKYRGKQELEKIHQTCKELNPEGLIEILKFSFDDMIFISYHPYYDYDLSYLIKRNIFDNNFSLRQFVLGQLIDCIDSYHSIGLVHCDLKPGNILVNKQGDIIICDLDQLQIIENQQKLQKYVGSLHYKAVELFYGFEQYGLEIDIWSFGCIGAELILGKPLFDSQGEFDQLAQIYSYIKQPNQLEQQEISSLENYFELQIDCQKDLQTLLSKGEQEEIEIIKQCLNPIRIERPSQSLQKLLRKYSITQKQFY